MKQIDEQLEVASTVKSMPRRRFLQFAGLAAGAGLVATSIASCSKDKDNTVTASVNLGSGDVGILNYAYALEQLEAAFYTQVIATPYSSITTGELSLLTDIRDHEIAHREFFKAALAGNAIAALEVDFSSINFTDRNSVLGTAKAFEDLGVAAYNGAGKLITTPDYLVLAGKIVSVEARHAAYIRDLISNGSFADNTAIDLNGLDMAKMPSEVLPVAVTYLKVGINYSGLPTA